MKLTYLMLVLLLCGCRPTTRSPIQFKSSPFSSKPPIVFR